MPRTSVLLLAGSTEAAQLARLLAGHPDIEVTASFAGRTTALAQLPCRVRVGGFGGVAGLLAELRGYDLLVDATHPFAARMPHHGAAAATVAGLPRLRLLRPPWRPRPGDRWHPVPDLENAARRILELGARRVLLTTGRHEMAPFADLAGVHVVLRSIEAPAPDALPAATVILARGPFDVAGESALLHAHRIDALVTKNSGAAATAAKLTAARCAGVPVVLVQRPVQPAGPLTATAEQALAWIMRLRRP